MQSRGKQEKNADRENRIERDEEYLRLFQRGQKILGGGWILVMAVSALLFSSGIYFTLSGRGEWIDMAAVLIPFLITGAILLFLASPYKKGAAEVKNTAGAPSKGRKSSFSPSTWRITSSFSETSSGKFAVLSGILFLTAGILILMGALFLWLGRAEGDLLVFASGAFLVSLGFPAAAFGILDVSHAVSRRKKK